MPEMYIDSIRLSPMNYQRVVILKEKDADRYLPIWIGQFEADAIAVKLQEVKVPRPLTHDLLGNVIDAMGGVVKRVVVSDLQNDTFYAKIILEYGDNTNGHSKEVDSRPSDALALAVRTGVPIFVDEGVLSKAGVQLEEETKAGADAAGDDPAAPPGEDELRGMSAFADFVEGLDLGDLDKGPNG
ncbi:MAG: bifunctional nuclease family protein [Chloroflexota bacterium]|nr:bifunctional nuclease family protein [Chloroflexota bacterium]